MWVYEKERERERERETMVEDKDEKKRKMPERMYVCMCIYVGLENRPACIFHSKVPRVPRAASKV